jgi:hypothetical protein
MYSGLSIHDIFNTEARAVHVKNLSRNSKCSILYGHLATKVSAIEHN